MIKRHVKLSTICVLKHCRVLHKGYIPRIFCQAPKESQRYKFNSKHLYVNHIFSITHRFRMQFFLQAFLQTNALDPKLVRKTREIKHLGCREKQYLCKIQKKIILNYKFQEWNRIEKIIKRPVLDEQRNRRSIM